MVKFVAKKLAVDNSDLSELDGYKPFSSPVSLSISISSTYQNGDLTVKVTQDGALKYKLSDISTSRSGANKLFKGKNWESKLFDGADEIKGSKQADSLYGFDGKDTILGKAGDDMIYGGKGKDDIHGDAGGDTIEGGGGNDVLDGDDGVNTLTGGGGKDAFAFSAKLMAGNYSEITDFETGKDQFQLSKSAFDGVGNKGALKAAKFFLESEYTGKSRAVIYDEATGTVKYSKAGGSIDNAIAFGRVEIGTELSYKDFLIA